MPNPKSAIKEKKIFHLPIYYINKKFGSNILKLNGRYLIVDPCYIFENDWKKICDEIDNDNNWLVMTINNFNVFMFGTTNGDGEYKVGNGKCLVDSGLLSIIPEGLITSLDKADDVFGVWGELHGDITIVEVGIVKIGSFVIDTSVEEDDEEDGDD